MNRTFGVVFSIFVSVGAMSIACGPGETVQGPLSGTANTTGAGNTTGAAGTTGQGNISGSGNTTGVAGTTGQGNTTGQAGRGGTTGQGNITGQAGTTGSGNITGAAGVTGVGNTTGAAGVTGSAGTTGSGNTTGCNPMVPTQAMITDFDMTMPGDAMTLFKFGTGPSSGGPYTYGAPTPQIMLMGGALHATLTAPSSATTQYVGFGLYFNSCVNASSYAGVKFKLAGTVTGCTIQYSSNYSENAKMSEDPKGSCIATSCYSSQKTITVPASGDVSVAWADQTGGAPVATVNPGKLVAVQWQFTVPASMACSVDITIDNVTFY